MAYVRTKFPKDNRVNSGRKGYWQDCFCKKVHKLALLGATDKDMAEILGVNLDVFEYWKQQKPDFLEALNSGKMEADSNVAQALYKRAIGYHHKETVVVSNKVVEYNRETKTRTERTEPLLVDIVKYYPPDTAACNKWLSIRQRKVWADVQKHEVDVNYAAQIDITYIQQALSDRTRISDEDLKRALEQSLKTAFDTQQKALTSN